MKREIAYTLKFSISKNETKHFEVTVDVDVVEALIKILHQYLRIQKSNRKTKKIESSPLLPKVS